MREWLSDCGKVKGFIEVEGDELTIHDFRCVNEDDKRQGHSTRVMRELRQTYRRIIVQQADSSGRTWWPHCGRLGLIDEAYDGDGKKIWPIN